MAKRKRKQRRKRRTADEIISDLQEEIRRVRDRQKSKELRDSPAHKAAIAALKAVDRALDIAADQNETTLRHVLADGRKPLGEHLEKLGLRLPKANLPKGRRPKDRPKE